MKALFVSWLFLGGLNMDIFPLNFLNNFISGEAFPIILIKSPTHTKYNLFFIILNSVLRLEGHAPGLNDEASVKLFLLLVL